MLKSAKELSELPDDSTDVFKLGPIDRYIKRPVEMDDDCYADFVACYTFKGKSKRSTGEEQDEQEEDAQEEADTMDALNSSMPARTLKRIQLEDGGELVLRRSPKVIRFCRFDFHKDPENFFREQIMLFVPWRNEKTELEDIDHAAVFTAKNTLSKRIGKSTLLSTLI